MNTFQRYSFLTRKVFSRHNLSAQVFCSISSGSSSSPRHLHLQVISIFNSSSSSFVSGSSLNLDHHHWIWIIIIGTPSLDLDHPSIWIISGASYLDLDHPLIWIISAVSSTLNLHGCYLMILLVTRSSTEPALFHPGYRPSVRVGLLPALISDPKTEWPTQHLYLIM